MCLAVPGQVLSLAEGEPLLKMARVSFGGLIKEVSLAYVPEVQVGDYVIVHVGFALTILDREEAEKTLNYLQEIKIQASNLSELRSEE